MSDTPETDKAFDVYTEGPHDDAGDPWALASRLERERDTMREENRKLRELCGELFEAIDEHADYRVQPGGGYTKERILIEKTDQLLNP
jgi:hypothetical protein